MMAVEGSQSKHAHHVVQVIIHSWAQGGGGRGILLFWGKKKKLTLTICLWDSDFLKHEEKSSKTVWPLQMGHDHLLEIRLLEKSARHNFTIAQHHSSNNYFSCQLLELTPTPPNPKFFPSPVYGYANSYRSGDGNWKPPHTWEPGY